MLNDVSDLIRAIRLHEEEENHQETQKQKEAEELQRESKIQKCYLKKKMK
jgi:hypothetical protein